MHETHHTNLRIWPGQKAKGLEGKRFIYNLPKRFSDNELVGPLEYTNKPTFISLETISQW